MSYDVDTTSTIGTHDTRKAEGDFVVILSSEMISDIVQQYFNDEMYKRRVEVVDTKATETGYAFSVAWYGGGGDSVKQDVYESPLYKERMESTKVQQQGRNGKGKYTKIHRTEERDSDAILRGL